MNVQPCLPYAAHLLLVILLAVPVTSCATISKLVNGHNATLAALDDAILALQAESADWKTVIDNLQRTLPAEAQGIIRTEIQNTLVRATAAAETQIQCVVDFVRARVGEDLRQIKALVTGGTMVRRPRICEVVPDAIRLDLQPNRRDLVTYHGYNLDKANFRVRVEQRQGGYLEFGNVALDQPTHYKLTLNLSASGIELSSQHRRVILQWDGGNSEVAVVVPSLPPCEKTVENVNLGERTYIPPWDPSTGDREFWGKVDITVRTSIQMVGDRLRGRVYMKAEQWDDDHTRAEGTDSFDTSFVVPSGWRFVSFVTPTTDEMQYRDTDWEDDYFERSSGLVRRYVVVGDTGTAEAGTRTSVRVTFNPVAVRLVQVVGCAP